MSAQRSIVMAFVSHSPASYAAIMQHSNYIIQETKKFKAVQNEQFPVRAAEGRSGPMDIEQAAILYVYVSSLAAMYIVRFYRLWLAEVGHGVCAHCYMSGRICRGDRQRKIWQESLVSSIVRICNL